jgi:hypothetical protein
MAYSERKTLMAKIDRLREGRRLVTLCNFDRHSEPKIPGILTQFHADLKECLGQL